MKKLPDQYNGEYPAHAKEYNDPVTAGWSEPLSGEKLTPEQTAAPEDRKKE